MKATGIVRRIDDLGRVVIPKEIRRTLRIREGDPLEIFTNTDGGVIFRKYSPVPVLICDSDHVVAAAGVSKKEFLERRVTQAMEDYMQSRQKFVGSEADHALRPIEGIERNASVVYPIIASSDVTGAIIILFDEKNTPPTQVEVKLAQAAAAFLGKQMED